MSPPASRPPHGLDPKAVHARVLDVLLRGAEPGLKPGFLRHAAGKVAAAILRSSLTSKDRVHFGALSTMYRLNDRHGPLSEQAILALSRYVLRGRVMPVQRLREVVLEAHGAYLGRCPCRASGRVADRDRRGPAAASDDDHLGRILRVWDDPAIRMATDPELARAFATVARSRRAGRPGGTLADLERELWPYWEILLEHPGYDRCWIDGLVKNGKARRLPPALLGAWVDALYEARGVIYTHMEAAGLPYAICTCPGPETDGGCLLTNWHYCSGNEDILVPNATEKHGQRRDPTGRVLGCRQHEARQARPCLGCGCDHAADEGVGRDGPGSLKEPGGRPAP